MVAFLPGAGEEIKFAFTAGGSAYIEGIEFNVSAVPEPTSFLMFGMVIAGGLGFRRRKA